MREEVNVLATVTRIFARNTDIEYSLIRSIDRVEEKLYLKRVSAARQTTI